ncbi:MAG: HAMP domain-containing protein [Anaerolineae bacterium]|nr:HAMP domain-containing protein [Anaerolineae bacterium]
MQDAIIINADQENTQTLAKLLSTNNMRSLMISNIDTINAKLEKYEDFQPSVAIIDIDLKDDGWLIAFKRITRLYPDIGVLFTTDRSDPHVILRAKAHGAEYFMRAPFTDGALKQALKRMTRLQRIQENSWREKLPKIQVPVRVKITFPYVFLAMLIILGAAYIISNISRETVEDRFLSQLVDTARMTTNWMVEEEDRLLSTLRLLLNTEGIAEATAANDAERLREMILPVAINAGEEGIGILNGVGENVLTLLHSSGSDADVYNYFRGGSDFLGASFISKVYALQIDVHGDKYAGLIYHDTEPYFYVAGPLYNREGFPIGIILVGKSIQTISREMRVDTLAHITLYTDQGRLIFSTFYPNSPGSDMVSMNEFTNSNPLPAEQSLVKAIEQNKSFYREIIGRWQARGSEPLGLIGVTLPETILVESNKTANAQIFALFFLAIGLVLFTGLMIANRITKPLLQVVDASEQISKGNYDVNIQSTGNDEVAILAHSFNEMVSGLKEGSVYRDLLGRTVSPEVRDQLRATISSGSINMEGQDAMATVLMADVAGFTNISENEAPATVLDWLNELFSELVPIINGFSGVVNEFSGDGLFSFFGILPQPLHMAESAYLACRAAVEMLNAVDKINLRRVQRGNPPIRLGIGINTGPVTAGGLGAEDRMHYTIIGDVVNTTQRIESLAHQFPESSIMISRQTAIAIWNQRDQFILTPHGEHHLKGKQNKQLVYRLEALGNHVPENQKDLDELIY